jgi:hypothetical protein
MPAVISLHAEHTLQGLAVGFVAFPSSPRQLRHLARRRALVVFPTPRTPVKRNACATRPESIAFASVRATCSWPTRSSNVCGRYFRARTR